MKRFSLILFCIFFTFSLAGCTGALGSDREINPKSGSAATLTLYSFDGKSEGVFAVPVLGHAFLSLKNNTASDISIYDFVIKPQEEITFGAWGQSAFFGIWFNIEGYYMSLGRYKGIVSVSQDVDMQDLVKMTEHIANNDIWTPTRNCSQFALAIWNKAENNNIIDDVNGLTTPEKLANSIRKFKNFETDRQPQTPSMVAYKKDGAYVFCPPAA